MRGPVILSATAVPAACWPGDPVRVEARYVPGTIDHTETLVYSPAVRDGVAGVLSQTWTVPDAVTDQTSWDVRDDLGEVWPLASDDHAGLAVFAHTPARPVEVQVAGSGIVSGVASPPATTRVDVCWRAATLVGACVPRGSWQASQVVVGPSNTHRRFYTTLPAVFDPDGTPPECTMIVSYTQRGTNVAAYVDSVPEGRTVWLTHRHEPENHTDAYPNGAAYVRALTAEAEIINGRGHPGVEVVVISGGYAYRKDGRADVLAGNYLRGLGGVVARLCKDIYQGNTGASGYAWPSRGLADYDQWQNWEARALDTTLVGQRLPLACTEYGVYASVGTPARVGRILADLAYLRAGFGPGGDRSPLPLGSWCYWQVPPKASEPQSGTPLTAPEERALWRDIAGGRLS